MQLPKDWAAIEKELLASFKNLSHISFRAVHYGYFLLGLEMFPRQSCKLKASDIGDYRAAIKPHEENFGYRDSKLDLLNFIHICEVIVSASIRGLLRDTRFGVRQLIYKEWPPESIDPCPDMIIPLGCDA